MDHIFAVDNGNSHNNVVYPIKVFYEKYICSSAVKNFNGLFIVVSLSGFG